MAHRTVRWCTGHDTVHCSVRVTSANRWGLERLIVEVLCPLATLDNPVRSDFWLAQCSLFIWHRSRPLGAVDRCSVGSPNMSGAHQTVRWIIAERLWKNPRAASSWMCSAWAPNSVWFTPDSVRCTTGSTNACLCSKLVEFPNLFSLLVYVELYAPEINDN
jgi:hypothetical protein